MNNKPKLIIVEGAQGVGKGAITNILREQMPYTNLFRLSGLSNDTLDLKTKTFKMRELELDTIFYAKNTGMNFILDRSHLSERVYCKLNYKPYSFKHETNKLNDKLNSISEHYDTRVVLLKATKETITKRLSQRDKVEFNKLAFRAENSIAQQDKYVIEVNKLAKTSQYINFITIDTDNKTPEEIAKIIMEDFNYDF